MKTKQSLKLYIPVVSRKVKVLKRGGRPKSVPHVSVTLILAKNCPLLFSKLPDDNRIRNHLMAMVAEKRFSSIKILVAPWEYRRLCREIAGKTGKAFCQRVIDLVVSVGDPPVIQIIYDEQARRRRGN